MKYLSVEIWQGDEFAEMHGTASEAIDAAKWKFEHTSLKVRKECTVEAWQVQDHIFVKDEDGNEIPGAVCCIIWSSASEESE